MENELNDFTDMTRLIPVGQGAHAPARELGGGRVLPAVARVPREDGRRLRVLLAQRDAQRAGRLC